MSLNLVGTRLHDARVFGEVRRLHKLAAAVAHDIEKELQRTDFSRSRLSMYLRSYDDFLRQARDRLGEVDSLEWT